MRPDRMIAVLPNTLAAAIIAIALAGCSTVQPAKPPEPAPQQTPINSLAYEQCVRAHGVDQCADSSN